MHCYNKYTTGTAHIGNHSSHGGKSLHCMVQVTGVPLTEHCLLIPTTTIETGRGLLPSQHYY